MAAAVQMNFQPPAWTVDQKNNYPNLNKLAAFAGGDTKHDFDERYVGRNGDNIRAIFDLGNPRAIQGDVQVEAQLFLSIFLEARYNNGIINHTGTVQSYFDVAEPNPNLASREIEFKIGTGQGPNDIHHLFISTRTPIYTPNPGDPENTGQLMQSGHAQGADHELIQNNPALSNSFHIVDTAGFKFFHYCKQGLHADNTINIVNTSEVMNDAATKLTYDSPIFANNTTGINLRFLEEVAGPNGFRPRTYTSWDNNTVGASTQFFSNYNFRLTPLEKQIKVSGKKVGVTCDLIITPRGDARGLKDKPGYTVQDGHANNSIKSLSPYIQRLFQKFLPLVGRKNNPDEYDVFTYNSKLQQKRSGDWFQALICILLYLSIHLQEKGMDGNPIGPELTVPLDRATYYVTGDRIAAAFALLMGINVILLNWPKQRAIDGTVLPAYAYVFTKKNIVDALLTPAALAAKEAAALAARQAALVTAAATEDAARLARVAEYTAFYTKVNLNTILNLTLGNLNIFLNNYRTFRQDLINTYTGIINAKLAILETSLVATTLEQNIKELFQAAVILSYIYNTLPICDTCLQTLTNFNNNIVNFNEQSNAYNFACALYKEHGGIIGANGYASNKFINTISRGDPYQSIARWIPETRLSSRLFNRLANALQLITDVRQNNKLLFLYNVSFLPEDIKTRIYAIFVNNVRPFITPANFPLADTRTNYFTLIELIKIQINGPPGTYQDPIVAGEQFQQTIALPVTNEDENVVVNDLNQTIVLANTQTFVNNTNANVEFAANGQQSAFIQNLPTNLLPIDVVQDDYAPIDEPQNGGSHNMIGGWPDNYDFSEIADPLRSGFRRTVTGFATNLKYARLVNDTNNLFIMGRSTLEAHIEFNHSSVRKWVGSFIPGGIPWTITQDVSGFQEQSLDKDPESSLPLPNKNRGWMEFIGQSVIPNPGTYAYGVGSTIVSAGQSIIPVGKAIIPAISSLGSAIGPYFGIKANNNDNNDNNNNDNNNNTNNNSNSNNNNNDNTNNNNNNINNNNNNFNNNNFNNNNYDNNNNNNNNYNNNYNNNNNNSNSNESWNNNSRNNNNNNTAQQNSSFGANRGSNGRFTGLPKIPTERLTRGGQIQRGGGGELSYDQKFGSHPLIPLYLAILNMFPTLLNEFNSDYKDSQNIEYPAFISLYMSLKKMVLVLKDMINNTEGGDNNVASVFLIGDSLVSMLFKTLNATKEMNTVLDFKNNQSTEYFWILVRAYLNPDGVLLESPEDVSYSNLCFQSPIISDFFKKVDINSIFPYPVNDFPEKLTTLIGFQTDMGEILGEIYDIVCKTSLPPSQIQLQQPGPVEPLEQGPVGEPGQGPRNNLGIGIQGITPEERRMQAERANAMASQNPSQQPQQRKFGRTDVPFSSYRIPESIDRRDMISSTVGNNRNMNRGGKKTRKYKNKNKNKKQRKTRKTRTPNKKTSKSRTYKKRIHKVKRNTK